MKNNHWFILLLLLIILGVVLRLSFMFQNTPFAEPDNFMYYSAALHFGLLPYSSFPIHNTFSEGPGLWIMPVSIYFVTFGFFSILSIMEWLPVFFGIGGAVIAYLWIEKALGDRKLALLGLVIALFIPAGLFRTMWGEYRGESFVPLFVSLMALGFLYLKLNIEDKKTGGLIGRIAIVLFLLAVILYTVYLSIFMWNGGIYIIPIFILEALGLILILFFKNLSVKNKFMIMVLAAAIGFIIIVTHYYYLLESSMLWISEASPPTIGTFITYGGLPALFSFVFFGIFLFGFVYKSDLFHKQYNKYKDLMILIFPFVIVTFFLASTIIRWEALLAFPIAVMTAVTLAFLKPIISNRLYTIIYLLLFFSTILIGIMWSITIQHVPSLSQGYYKSLGWIDNNTDPNVTFLSIWQDGSGIEGWANRSSYTDSVFSMNTIKIEQYSAWLWANNRNETYICNVSPNYLFINTPLYTNSTAAIFQVINQSAEPAANSNFNSLINSYNYSGLFFQVYNSDGIKIYKVGVCPR